MLLVLSILVMLGAIIWALLLLFAAGMADASDAMEQIHTPLIYSGAVLVVGIILLVIWMFVGGTPIRLVW